MRRLLAIVVVVLALPALSDTSMPGQKLLQFAGRTIDLRSGKVIRTDAGKTCPDPASFPSKLARREGERRKLAGTPVQVTDDHALFASFWGLPRREGELLELATGKRTHLDDEPAVLIEDEQRAVMGIIVIDEKKREVRRLDGRGNLVWRTAVASLRGDRARAVVAGDHLLYVAPFEAISTSAQLFALDWHNGGLVWTGSVRNISAAHSEYEHDVRLSVVGDYVVFEGVESAGCTLQLFHRRNRTRVLELTEIPGGWGR